MPTTAKEKGARREREVKKTLESNGYCCSKSGGSLGLFDIICINNIHVRLIQVKTGYCSPAERETIKNFRTPSKVIKEIWIFKKWKKKNRIKREIYYN